MTCRQMTSNYYLLPDEKAEKEREKVEMSREYPHFTKAQIEETIKLFEQADKDKNGSIDRNEFSAMMHNLAPDSLSENPNFQQTVSLYFTALDKDKSNSISKKELLELYNDLFINERTQVALLLTASFPGVPLQKLASVLEELEKLEVDGTPLVDKDELYQLKEEITPDLAEQLKKINLTEYLSKPSPDYKAITQAFLREHQGGKAEQGSVTPVGSGLDILRNLQQLVSTEKLLGGFFSKWGSSQTPQVEVVSRDIGGFQPSDVKSDVARLFEAFKNADELRAIIDSFSKLKEACGVTDTDFKAAYKKIKDKVAPVVNNSRVFWALIDKRLNQAEYKNPPKPPAKVVVIGAGPGGLRAGVEAAFLGNEVTILDKRDLFSRNNLLHVWDATIRDLKNIGAKYFYPRFCLGGVNHISIRGLQGLLLKLNLLLGSHVILNVGFQSVKHLSSPAKTSSGREVFWTVEIQPASKDSPPNYTKEDLYVNALVGADGENSTVAKFSNFQKKVLQGSRAIGITTNFVNTKTTPENSIKEVSLLAVYHQDFFKKLNDQYGIDLENLVYYREDTHYLVMCAKTESLVQKGVLKNKYPNIDQLLARENKDTQKLENFVREVATYLGIPSTCQFVQTPSKANDVAIFDFSKKQQSVVPLQYLTAPNAAQNLPVVLTGDALVEPFWPLGTGANRAILAALDAAWVLKRSFGSDQKVSSQQILKEASSAYRVLMTCTPDDLVSNFGLHSIEPSTRYRAVSKFR